MLNLVITSKSDKSKLTETKYIDTKNVGSLGEGHHFELCNKTSSSERGRLSNVT